MKLLRKLNFSLILICLLATWLVCASAAEVDLTDRVIQMGSEYTHLISGEEYVYFLLRSEGKTDSADPDQILYMNQMAADELGTLSFCVTPNDSGPAVTMLRGKESDKALEITWVLTDDGTLFITGNGVIHDEMGWRTYASDVSRVEIGGSVQRIENNAFALFPNLSKINFMGNAPDFSEECFAGVTASISYPHNNSSWTDAVMRQYGGEITWEKPHSHTFGSWTQTKAPGCESEGEEKRTCSCGEEERRAVPPSGHQWDSGIVVKEPTEDQPGEKKLTCTDCGKSKIQTIPELSHVHQYTKKVIAPTCTQSGYNQYTCSCGDTYTDGRVPPTGHRWSEWEVTVPATGASEGQRRRVCSICGESETEIIEKLTHPFVDVAPGKFYETPVLWAVENGITNGMDATHFAPGDKCNRAQVVTFLWRAAGSPEPTSTQNPFVDVVEGKFYYKAVLWAVEMGITNGIDGTHFGTNDECTRGHVATFLWRTLNKPSTSNIANPFTDVPAGKFYYDPVLWAVQSGVTNGIDATHFAPGQSCTRGQIVTFLYRALGE